MKKPNSTVIDDSSDSFPKPHRPSKKKLKKLRLKGFFFRNSFTTRKSLVVKNLLSNCFGIAEPGYGSSEIDHSCVTAVIWLF